MRRSVVKKLINAALWASSFMATGQVLADTYADVVDHSYADQTDKKTSIRALAQGSNNPKGWLVLVWANWCLPCKAELKLVTEQRDLLQGVLVVAINVDDASDWPNARTELEAMGFPYISLRDPGGEHLYEYHSSGQIPLALAFDNHGSLRNIYNQMHLPELTAAVAAMANQEADEATVGLSVSHRSRYQTKHQSDKPDDAVFANRSSLKQRGNNYTVALSYEFLMQKNEGQRHFGKPEDEIGPSYLEMTKTWTNVKGNLRFGAKSVMNTYGLGLAVRTSTEDNRDDYLLGLHANLDASHVSFGAFGGRIKNTLFPPLIDPSLDLSVNLPDYRAYGAYTNVILINDKDWNLKFGTAYTQLHRASDLKLGYASDYHDERWSGDISWESPVTILDIKYSRYLNEKRATEPLGYATIASLGTRPWDSASLRGARVVATMVKREMAPVYTFIPVLTDDLAKPLENRDVLAYRGLAAVSLPDLWETNLSPSYTQEKSLNEPANDSHRNLAAIIAVGKQGFKVQGSHSDKELATLAKESKEQTYALASPLLPHLSGRLEWRQIREKAKDGNQDRGRRQAATLEFLLPQLFTQHSLTLTATVYEQHGLYQQESGLNQRLLRNGTVRVAHKNYSFDVFAGQEPGGIVCTAGSCSRRFPRDGIGVDASVYWQF